MPIPKLPENIPELGFYYHYKHDPRDVGNNYAYEVVGVGCHTEDNCRPEDAFMVVYRPLYKSSVYEAGKLFDLRPLEIWVGTVNADGVSKKRFTKITDEHIIKQLQKVRTSMYP